MTYPFASIPADHFLHRAKRFPIRADTKQPAFYGWQNRATADTGQLNAWASSYSAFAVACAENGWIVVESDPKALRKKGDETTACGHELADAELSKFFVECGLSADLQPHIFSRSGGKHFYFEAPAGVDLKEGLQHHGQRPYRYRQGALVKLPGWHNAIVEAKVNGYALIPPSAFKGRAYTINPKAPLQPYLAPQILLDKLQRIQEVAPNIDPNAATATIKAGMYEARPLIKKIMRVHLRYGMDYEVWRNLLFSLVAQFGKGGAYTIARSIHDGESKTDESIASIINGASETYRLGDATLSSFFKYASDCGDKENVPKTTAAMWGGKSTVPDLDAIIAEIDAEETSLVIASPPIAPAVGAIPMTGRGEAQAKAWASIIASLPTFPRTDEHPVMPDTGHPLRDAINTAIPGIVASGDPDALAVVTAIHSDTASKIATLIPTLDHAAIAARASGIIEEVENDLKPADYVRDHKGEIQNDNIDNVAFFLSQLAAEIRWNAWTESMEVRGWKWNDWTFVNDHVVTLLRARASQTGTRFRVGKDFLWDSLLALSLRHKVDPVLDTIKQFEQSWDGVPRLDTWLHYACGVPDDAYHRAVSRNVIGGIIKRVRQPGCKHDEVLLFIGEQGTNKSTVPSTIAIQEDWFTDEIELGDPSKELVLSLAGKLVVEIGEMGRKTVAGNNTVKSMLTRRTDRGRTAYARTVTARPRRNIFVATTNDPEPLSDLTGNRRWLPVRIGAEINIEWLTANTAQIVGEAAVHETRGDTFRIPRELWGTAAAHQEAATETPEYQSILREWLAPGGLSVFMTIADLSHIAREAAGGRVVKSSEYNRVVERLGFRRQTKRVDGKPADVWLRGEGKEAYRLTAASLRSLPRGVSLSMAIDVPQSAAPLATLAPSLPQPPY
jgi:predicted P-loop ATPase